jgi:hypothetical protein
VQAGSAAIAAIFSAVAAILPAVLTAVDTVGDNRSGPDDSRGAGHGRTNDTAPGHACWSQWHITLLPLIARLRLRQESPAKSVYGLT